MNDGFQNILKQAQQFQETFQKAQAEILHVQATGESGAGMVKVTLNGSYEALKVTLDPSVQDSPELLEELIASAITAAAHKVKSAGEDKMREMTSGFNLPADFKMPF